MYYNDDSRFLRLSTRNEGKLKVFESCNDLRAWSHDAGRRCRYLKEWVKSDMPTCVIPPRILTQIILRMTYIPYGKAVPRCNPGCKSRVVLESICETCQVIRDWLLDYQDFDKYFEEEEYETSHWPCERCVEALKSIKMFWKIISEKIFNVPDIKTTKIEDMPINNKSNVRNVIKNWQTDMIEKINCAKKLIYSADIRRDNKEEGVDCCNCDCKTKGTCTSDKKLRKVSRYASVRVKTHDKETDAPEFFSKMILHFEQRLDFLEREVSKKDGEIDNLLAENQCLKSQVDTLEKVREEFSPSPKAKAVCATPYGEINNFTEIDSEMIITMKKCADKNFKHISVLQILHKSNQPISSELDLADVCQKKEDPIKLLRKVQSAFGMFVRRELVIANGRRSPREKVDIDTTSSIQNCEDGDKTRQDQITGPFSQSLSTHFLTDIDTSSNFDLLSACRSDIDTFTCCTSSVTSGFLNDLEKKNKMHNF